MNSRDRQEWRRVDGLEVRLVTGELAKVQLEEGQGRAHVIGCVARGTLMPAVLFGTTQRVDIVGSHVVWIGRR